MGSHNSVDSRKYGANRTAWSYVDRYLLKVFYAAMGCILKADNLSTLYFITEFMKSEKYTPK